MSCRHAQLVGRQAGPPFNPVDCQPRANSTSRCRQSAFVAAPDHVPLVSYQSRQRTRGASRLPRAASTPRAGRSCALHCGSVSASTAHLMKSMPRICRRSAQFVHPGWAHERASTVTWRRLAYHRRRRRAAWGWLIGPPSNRRAPPLGSLRRASASTSMPLMFRRDSSAGLLVLLRSRAARLRTGPPSGRLSPRPLPAKVITTAI